MSGLTRVGDLDVGTFSGGVIVPGGYASSEDREEKRMVAPLPTTSLTAKPVEQTYRSPVAFLFVLMAVFFVVLAIVSSVFGGSNGAAFAVAVLMIGVLILFALVAHTTHSIQPYEVGLVTVFGSYRGTLRPGFNLVTPLAFVRKVDLRTKVGAFDEDGLRTKDHAVLHVTGAFYYKVIDALAATYKVQDSSLATVAQFQTQLREIARERNASEVLTDVEGFQDSLRDAVNENTQKWGVRMEAVEIKNVLPGNEKVTGVSETLRSLSNVPPESACPYCRGPMEKGSVGAESLSGGAKWHTSRSTLALGGEPVGDYTDGGMVWLDGYRCRTCGRLVLQG